MNRILAGAAIVFATIVGTALPASAAEAPTLGSTAVISGAAGIGS